MAERRKKIRGSTAALDGIAGLEGMFAFDRQAKEIRVYDGVTIGGFRIPNKATNDAALTVVLNDYYTKAAADALVGEEIGLALEDYSTTEQVNTALTENATASTAYVNSLGLGLTNAAVPSPIVNIDDVTMASGIYRYNATTLGTFPASFPASVTGIINFERTTTAAGRQTMQPAGDRRVFRRELVAGVWGDWNAAVLTSSGTLANPGLQVGYTTTGYMASGGPDFMQGVINGTLAHTTEKLYGDIYGLATRLDVNGYVAGKRIGGEMQYQANLLAECSSGNSFSAFLGDGVAYAQTLGASFRAVPVGGNTGASTLSLNGAAAVQVRTVTGAVLPSGYIEPGVPVTFTRYSGHWRVSRDTEIITNGNGYAIKNADGSLICTVTVGPISIGTAFGALYRSDSITWTFPVAFSQPPAVTGGAGDNGAWASPAAPSAFSASFRFLSAINSLTNLSPRLIAIGRWY